MNASASDPILSRLKDDLQHLYGARLEQTLLYGSRARGDFAPDSDYDVLVVLRDPFDWWEEVKQLAHISSALTMDTGAVLSLRPVTPDHLREPTGFMQNVRREAHAI